MHETARRQQESTSLMQPMQVFIPWRVRRWLVSMCLIVACAWSPALASEEDMAAALQALSPDVLSRDDSLRSMLYDDARARLVQANQRASAAWRAVASREDWERMRDPRIAALKASLGQFPAVPENLHVVQTGLIEGEGYRIEKLVFESRPGLLATANLYAPAEPAMSMPGMVICHSHHNPKTQGELQDMGIMWARQGCLALVMDQLGHGERRQHPFLAAEDYPGEFRVGRQDYYFRYNVSLQLHLVGESLMGWMVWDLMRGVDLLRAQPGVDPKRITLLGAVAGGGDPAASCAALDSRIAAAIPFNFGGPQPENRYPLPDDAETSFNYAGGGSWESTRNLRLSARDGFLPWVIVGAIAPRRLVYAHEFSWDQKRDPVWRRLQKIYALYNADDHLAFAHGYGFLKGRPPQASHCNNIGPPHRRMIYPALNRWFDTNLSEAKPQSRHPAEQLICLKGPSAESLALTPVHRLADRLAEERCTRFQQQIRGKSPAQQREALRQAWGKLLGDVAPYPMQLEQQNVEMLGQVRIERLLLRGERDIRLPVLLLIPARSPEDKLPLVVAVAQQGKAGFLRERSKLLAALLSGGAAVCLPDLRGCGETRPGDGRGRRSAATAISATELMLGQTLLGSQLKDLRSLLGCLPKRDEFDSGRVGLCGDSFSPINPPERPVEVPLDASQPHPASPTGALLALLGGLFEEDVAVVAANGGVVSFRSALQSPFLHAPHEAIVPGALTLGDLPDLVAALSGRPLRLGGLVDGLNRRVSAEDVAGAYAIARRSRRADELVVRAEPLSEPLLSRWLLEELRNLAP